MKAEFLDDCQFRNFRQFDNFLSYTFKEVYYKKMCLHFHAKLSYIYLVMYLDKIRYFHERIASRVSIQCFKSRGDNF